MAAKKKAARPKTKVKPKAKVNVKAKAKPAPKAKPKAARAPKPMSEEEMMRQWQMAATPSAGHARLMPMVGTWRATTTFTMAPGDAPQVSSGTSVHRMVLGGRFLEQVYKGTSMGMPFEGIGLTGYDNAQQKYVGAWMDSFGTGVMRGIGVGRPTDERIDIMSEAIEPSGQKRVFDTIIRIRDHSHHSYEMWTKGPNGKSFRMMIVEYERG
jgi:Protein of unknown function (DUF1579)